MQRTYMLVGIVLKWLVSKAPYLIQQHAIAPHITGSGVLLKKQSLQCINDLCPVVTYCHNDELRMTHLGSSPLDWNLPSMR